MTSSAKFTYEFEFSAASAEASARRLQQIYQQSLAQVKLPALSDGGAGQAIVSQAQAQQAQITAEVAAQGNQRTAAAKSEADARVAASNQATSQQVANEQKLTQQVKAQAQERSRLGSFAREAAGALGIGLGVAGGVALARQGVQTALDMERQATSYRRLQVAATGLAGSQAKLNELMKAYEQASGGVIDRATAVQNVTRLMAVGFADSTEELRQFTEAARGISIATGQSQENVNSLLELAIANQSTLRLNELGLGITEVKDRIADLRAENKALTEEEAYQIAILGAANDKFGALADSVEAQKTSVEKLTIAWHNWYLELSQNVAPYVDKTADFMRRQLDPTMEEEGKRIQGTIDWSLWMPGAANNPQIVARQQLVEAINHIVAAEKEGVTVSETYRESVERLSEATAVNGSLTRAQRDEIAALEQVYWAMVEAQKEGEEVTLTAEDRKQQAIELTEMRVQEQNAAWVALTSSIYTASAAGQEWIRIGTQAWGVVQGPSPIPSDDWFERQAALRNGGMLTIGGQSIAEAAQERDEERAKKAAADQSKAAREWESAAKKTASEMERAAEKMANDFEASLRSIPGLFGASLVTKGQMDLAAGGVPQNFADDYLRRLTDEVLNGVDWADVDIADAARRAGISQGLDPKTILGQFTAMWEDSSIFANPENLDLINMAAVEAARARQAASAAGEKNILSVWGLGGAAGGMVGTEGSSKYFTEAGGMMATGMMGGAQQELQEFGLNAVQIIASAMTGEQAASQWAELGATVGETMVTAIETAVAGTDFVGVIVAEAVRRINEQMDGEG